jgi:hypothetical protein
MLDNHVHLHLYPFLLQAVSLFDFCVDVNEHDYPTLHLDTKSSKGKTCSKKGYRCKWTWLSNITLGHKNQIKKV